MKQSASLGSWWGTLKLVGQQSISYAQFFTLMFSSIAAYEPIRIFLERYGIPFPFYVMVVGMLLIVLGLMVFEWKFSMPSFYASWNQQWWNHNNPLKDEVATMKADLEAIKKALNVQ